MRLPCVALCVALCAAIAPSLWSAQSETQGIHAVPTPGSVTIDGDLADWDLSGAYLQCYDVAELREIYSAKVAMMYDAQALYVAIHWVDNAPLGNSHDPRFSASKGWAGDSIQLRLKTDRICHVTGWCFAPTQEPCLQIDYGKSLTEPFGGGSRMLMQKDKWKLDDGAEMGFHVDADKKGYVQELKLPWALITTGKAFTSGEQIACGIELLWGETDWPLHRYADNLAPGATSREFFWTAYKSWGPVWLESQGHLTLPEPSWAAALKPVPAEGPVEVRYDLSKDARVTVAIDDVNGKRIRNLIAAEPRKAGANVERWDGLDNEGQPVAPGEYRLRELHHQSIHATYVMSFANPGDPTWSTPDGRGAFYGDHTAPTGVAAGGDMVALACPGAEAGPHLIGCDLAGRRRWALANRDSEFGAHTALATDGKILWVAQEDKRSFVYRVDLVTGRYAAWDKRSADGQPVLDLLVSEQPGARKGNLPINLRGIAWHAGEIAVCLEREGVVRILDAGTGAVKRSVPLTKARGITHVGDAWVVLAGDRLLRLGAGEPAPFGEAQWADAYALTTDVHANVLISRRGKDHDVAVIDADGHVVRTIGHHGGRPLSGAFDDQGMRDPAQLAVDRLGRVWVVEQTSNPKRTSVWGADGSLALQLNG
ncbi:MAG TPA: FlgD immunoglobulin-like domain containing protein, partial [Planctomycetota bacterium]|nr:FlgD immunoglobulin-like domain containing protein [Planctomycetota bacterium]